MATLKNIINSIESFCDEHLQIKEFGFGPTSLISTKNHELIMVWMMPTGGRQEQSSTFIQCDIYIFDLLKQSKENLVDVLNDTFMVGRDLISEFFDNDDLYEFEMNEVATAEPFDFNFDDLCAGWIFKIEIEFKASLNTCEIPLEAELEPVIVEYNILKNVDGGTALLETSSDIAVEGDIITITISNVESGKIISGITVIDEEFNIIELTTIIENEEYSFIMPANNVNITLELEQEIILYNINTNVVGAIGTVTPNPFTVGQTYDIKLKY